MELIELQQANGGGINIDPATALTALLMLGTWAMVIVVTYFNHRQLRIVGQQLKGMQKEREKKIILDVLNYAVRPLIPELREMRDRRKRLRPLMPLPDEKGGIAWEHFRKRFPNRVKRISGFNSKVLRMRRARISGIRRRKVFTRLINELREFVVDLTAEYNISTDELRNP